MGLMNKALITAAMIASFSSLAAVEVDFHRDVSPLVVDGEEIGFNMFSRDPYQLEDGQNQVVVRLSKLVDKQGEKEKFNSKVVVITFDTQDQSIVIEPATKVTRIDHAEKFNENPKFKLVAKSGDVISSEQASYLMLVA